MKKKSWAVSTFLSINFTLFEVTGLSWTILTLCDRDLPTALNFAFIAQASTPTSLFSQGGTGRFCDRSSVTPLVLT